MEAVQDILKAELTSIERLRLSIDESEDAEIEQISIISKEIRTLNRLANTLPQNLLKKLVERICTSNKIVVVGTRGSASLAQYFSYYLDKVKRNVVSICNGSTQVYDRLMDMGENDLIVAIAFPRYPRETIEIVRFCINQGIPVAGITDKIDSPMAELADIPLVIPITFSTIHDSFSSVLCIFNMLVTEVGRENRSESEALSVTFEDLARKTKLFFWYSEDDPMILADYLKKSLVPDLEREKSTNYLRGVTGILREDYIILRQYYAWEEHDCCFFKKGKIRCS